jgi:hypothetical protein
MLIRAMGHANPPFGKGERGRGHAVPGRHPSTISLFVGPIDAIRTLRTLPLNKLGRARHRKQFSQTANAKIPRVDHDFHVNKIPMSPLLKVAAVKTW